MKYACAGASNNGVRGGYPANLAGYILAKLVLFHAIFVLSQLLATKHEEYPMQRNDENRDDRLIDLGAIVEETKGSAQNFNDQDIGQRLVPGLGID